MLDLDTLPESQAASIAAIGGPVSQQLLDATAPIEDGEEYIRYLHEEALKDAQEAEECVAAKRAPKRKRLNEHLTEDSGGYRDSPTCGLTLRSPGRRPPFPASGRLLSP